MQDALTRAQSRVGVYAGQLWWLPDELVTFADADPGFRTRHRQRPIIVMQGDDVARNRDCATVLFLPLSSKVNRKEEWEEVLRVEDSPLDEPSVVKLQLIQPVERATLTSKGQFVGEIDAAMLQRIRFHLIFNLGIISSIPTR